jgi:hypothetical protein
MNFIMQMGRRRGSPGTGPRSWWGRCRLNKNKTKLFVTEKYNQDMDLHVSALA